MSFSTEWDVLYQDSTHLAVWPWTDVVSYVHRYARGGTGHERVLELGCGAGANIPFFLSRGLDYRSIEGSPAIVAKLHERYPQLREAIVAGDFTLAIPFDGPFDLVIDRVSLPHNATAPIARCLKLAHDKLRSGGLFMGFDWFSTEHVDSTRGERVDAYTRRNLPPDSHLAGTGNVHFFDQPHLTQLLTDAGFVIERMEHKCNQVRWPEDGPQLAWWNFVARKP